MSSSSIKSLSITSFCPSQVYKLSSTPSWWLWSRWSTSCCWSCLLLSFMLSLVLNYSLAFFTKHALTTSQVSVKIRTWYLADPFEISSFLICVNLLKNKMFSSHSIAFIDQERCLRNPHLVEASTSVPREQCVICTGRDLSTASPTLTTSVRACWLSSSASLSRAGLTCSTGCTTLRAGPGSGSTSSPWSSSDHSSSWILFLVSSPESSPKKEKSLSQEETFRN